LERSCDDYKHKPELEFLLTTFIGAPAAMKLRVSRFLTECCILTNNYEVRQDESWMTFLANS
jgi:hypothetical protein